MQLFIQYSLIASVFWGVMGTMESISGQYRMHSALVIKFIFYCLTGILFLLALKGPTFLYNDVTSFVQERPRLFLGFCLALALGSTGSYFLYCAFNQCANNKALAIIISYCVPSVIVALLSYFFLKESYNWCACVGVVLILAGVIIIDVYGVSPSPSLSKKSIAST